jgi:hypothetical protein
MQKTVIPDEQSRALRDPESRETKKFQEILDPPLSRGMTNDDTAC